MKRSTICSIYSAILLVVFSFGSITSSFAKSTPVDLSKVSVKQADNKASFVPFVNDAVVIEVPANNIGFHDFTYSLDSGVADVIMPVANAPPDS